VHPKTIYRWAQNRQIRHIKKGGILRFQKKDIDEWMESGQNGKNYTADFLQKFDLSLENYDKMLLKRSNALSHKNSKRWCYGFGTVYIRKTKGGKTRFCIDYCGRDGSRRREVVKAAQTRAEALIVLQQRITEVFDASHSPTRAKNAGFKEFSKLYLEDYSKLNKRSWKCDEYALEAHLIPYFGGSRLCEITPLEIERYRAERLKAGVRKSTTNREMALLKKMFNLAVDWRYVRENPVRKVKMFSERENRKERVLRADEESRLLAVCADHLRQIVVTALNTGMRRGEILNLRWERVELGQRLIHVVKTKSGKDRVIPVNDVLFDVLGEKRAGRTGDYVFENPETGKPFRSVRHSFENACRRAGISGLRFHDLRHTFASRMVERGCDIETLRDLLGHHSVTVTQRYVHTDLDRKKAAVGLLGAKRAEKPPDLSRICHGEGEDEAEGAVTPYFSVN